MIRAIFLIKIIIFVLNFTWGLNVGANMRKTAAAALTSLGLIHAPMAAQAYNPAPLADVGLREFLVKDGSQHLRLSLPSSGKLGTSSAMDSGREAQEALELVRLRFEQVGYTNPSGWKASLKDFGVTEEIVLKKSASLRPPATAAATKFDDILNSELKPELSMLGDALRRQDIEGTVVHQERAAKFLAEARALSIKPKTLPYDIPEEYAGFPTLQGRAEVHMTVSTKRNRGFTLEDGQAGPKMAELVLEVDGLHAPITAGNFVDLVKRQWYDGMAIEENGELIVQTGKGKGKEAPRKIPLEIFYKKDATPTWSTTSDDDGRATDAPALPFQAYGALGMMRSNDDVDSATSEFFFLKWQQALIPPGRNTLDGYYSCFGYVTSPNAENVIRQLGVGDTIVKAEVVRGQDNLVYK